MLRGAIPLNSPDNGGAGEQDEESSDFDLVAQAQKGEYASFNELVTRHRGKVYAMIMNMVKNDADAWDLSQDAFIKAWKALPKFENRSQFSTWLFRISHNVVYDWMRKRKILSEGEIDDNLFDNERVDMTAGVSPKNVTRPDEALEKNELQAEIEKALSELSVDHREVVLLREIQGMDYKEIADVQGCSVGTIMSRLFYARKKLQTLLKK